MKIHSGKKPPTLGEFIARVYEVCGEQKAKGVVEFAIKTRMVELRHAKAL